MAKNEQSKGGKKRPSSKRKAVERDEVKAKKPDPKPTPTPAEAPKPAPILAQKAKKPVNKPTPAKAPVVEVQPSATKRKPEAPAPAKPAAPPPVVVRNAKPLDLRPHLPAVEAKQPSKPATPISPEALKPLIQFDRPAVKPYAKKPQTPAVPPAPVSAPANTPAKPIEPVRPLFERRPAAASLPPELLRPLIPTASDTPVKPRGKRGRPAGKRVAPGLKPVVKKTLDGRLVVVQEELPEKPEIPVNVEAFHGPEPVPLSFVDRGAPLPESYGMDRLVALVRDPQWMAGYWELTGGLLDRVRAERGSNFIDACAWVMRLHRLSEEIAVDVEVDPSFGVYYIHVGRPGKYQLELGLLTPDGEFYSLLASQVIETPGEGPSEVIDEQWRLRPEDEERLLGYLLKQLGAPEEGAGLPSSHFVGASRGPLPSSFVGASFSAVSSAILGSASGRPVAGSWALSFLGASGRPTSGGSGGFSNVGWLVGADGRHEAVLVRPSPVGGGPNWNQQNNLPQIIVGKTSAPHFKVKLPRVLKNAPRPAPTWPPTSRAAIKPTSQAKPSKPKSEVPALGASGR